MPKQNRIGCGAKCSFIIFFVLCIGILGFCVIGFIYMPYLTKGLNALACSIYRLVFHFLEGIDDGNKELKWIGLEKIHENITNIEKGNYESSLEKVSNMIDTFKEINNKTLESKKYKNLFFAGECIDIDGLCGGYNLSFAFASSSLVANSINSDI